MKEPEAGVPTGRNAMLERLLVCGDFQTAARTRQLLLASGPSNEENRDVKKVSLAQASANLPSLVDRARQQRVRTVIVDHGQPVAAIVPIEAELDERRHLSDDEIAAVFDGLGLVAVDRSAVDELVRNRR